LSVRICLFERETERDSGKTSVMRSQYQMTCVFVSAHSAPLSSCKLLYLPTVLCKTDEMRNGVIF